MDIGLVRFVVVRPGLVPRIGVPMPGKPFMANLQEWVDRYGKDNVIVVRFRDGHFDAWSARQRLELTLAIATHAEIEKLEKKVFEELEED